MQSLDLSKELAEVRAQILRLKKRELQLQKELQAADGAQSAVRPGWPIRRTPAAVANVANALH